MADGFSTAFANALVNVLSNTAPTLYTNVFFQLHTGPPGSAGTANLAAGPATARSSTTFAGASAGSNSISGVPSWTNAGTTETITDVTAWSASSSGTFLFSGSGCILAPIGLTISQTGSGGTFGGTGTYYYVVTSTNAGGETIASAEVYQTILSTADEVTLTWTAAANATGYKVYRGTTSGGENKLLTTITSGATVTYTDTGTAGTTATVPTTNTAGRAWTTGDTIQLTALAVALTPIAA